MSRRVADLGLAPIVAFVAATALVPVALLLLDGAGSVGGIGGVGRLISDPLNRAAFVNSLEQGSLSAAGAFLLGYPVGVFLVRHLRRGRSVLEGFLLVPFLLPSVVMAFAVRDLLGPGGVASSLWAGLLPLGSGIGGIVVANVAFNVSLVALFTAVGTESASPALEEAAATVGASPLRAYRDVWALPSLAGAAAGSLLTFVFSALAFAAPIVLCGARCYTVEARIWSLDTAFLDPSAAAILAGVLLAFLVMPTAVYLVLLGRLRRSRPRAHEARAVGAGPVRWLLGGITAAVVGGLVLLVGGVLVASVRPAAGVGIGGAWSQLFSARVQSAVGISVVGATSNTLAFATAAALTALLLGLLGGYVAIRRPRAGRWVLGLLYTPLLVSPIVLSLALWESYRGLATPTNVWLLILASQATIALPFAVQSLLVPLSQRSGATREAAQVLGASPFRAYLDGDVAALGAALRAAALFAFAISLGEFTATYFLTSLSTPTFDTLPVLLFALESPGVRSFPAANALSALLVLVSLVTLTAISIGGRRVEL